MLWTYLFGEFSIGSFVVNYFDPGKELGEKNDFYVASFINLIAAGVLLCLLWLLLR